MTSDMRLRNWAGNITFGAQRLHRPTTMDELQDLVVRTPRLRPLGTAHSFNRIADTDGDLVTVDALDHAIEIDEQTRVVDIPAGVRYGELAEVLHGRGWALDNLGSLPHISVAGACATGTHGSGVDNRCLATAVVGADVVRGDGELVTSVAGDADFGGAVLALGALGIATRLRLAIRPTFDLRQDVWLDAGLDAVLADLDAVLASGYSVSLFTDWRTPGRVDQVWIKSLTGTDPVDAARWGARRATVAQHPIAGADAATASAQLGAPGPWHHRLPHFRLEFTPSSGQEQQSEFFVARLDGADAIAAVAALDLGPALLVSEIRAVAADDLWLSPFRDRASVALHFTWVDDDALVLDAVRRVEAALAPFDARPHWAKVFTATPEEVRGHYPRLREFADLAQRWDPERRLRNDFLQRFVYPV
ncbi:MAG: FAD-binding protein [Jatrophihabitans sp.]